MRFIEIIAVTFSVVTLIVVAFLAVRAALAFKRTFYSFRRKAEPKAYNLINGGEIAQTRAFEIVDKLDRLQTLVEKTRVDLLRTWVLIDALKDAWGRVAPILSYVGLSR